MTKGKSLVISTGGSVEIGNGEAMIINISISKHINTNKLISNVHT